MNLTTGAEAAGADRVGTDPQPGRPASEVDAGFVLRGPDVLELFAAAVASHADAEALRCGPRRVTYAELDRAAAALAGRLKATWNGGRGVTALLLRDRVQVVVALLAVLRADGVFVPLDPDAPAPRLERILKSLDPDCLVADARSPLPAAGVAGKPMLALEADAAVGGPPGTGSPAPAGEQEARALDPVVPRYVYFTSGSTGAPKGIVGTLKGLSHFVRWEIATLGITPGTRVSQLTVPFFDAFLRDTLVPLCAGGTVCFPETPETVLDREELARWLEAERVNLVHCVPTVFAQLARAEADVDLGALRAILTAGEVLTVADVRRFRDRYGSGAEVVNLYGSTETTMIKFFHRVCEADLARAFVPIGRPMRGARALVLDEGMQVCPPGAVGEIYIRSPFLTLGYLGQPELTEGVFVPNPFSSDPADRIFRTGDLGRVLEDGSFQFLGRRDAQLKIRGVRVEPGEVENALLAHAAVQAAAVVARTEGGDRDDAGTHLVGYAAAPGARPELAADLRRHLEASLPAYLVPPALVVLDELPRLPNGKLDARSLPDPALAPPEEEPVVPRTETEAAVAEIWAEVLDRPRVFANQDFFRIGGHSLLAAQVISRVRRVLDVELPLRALFEAPTVEALASHVDTLRWMTRPQATASGDRQEIEL